jgi:hypothetical protein
MVWLRCGLGHALKPTLTGRLPGTQAALSCGTEDTTLLRQGTARARSFPETTTAKLARFFPNATPVRIPIQLTRVAGEHNAFSESTVIEFGTPNEVLFASTLPLEFADRLRLRNSDGTLDAEACVVAVQYHAGLTAVAARFLQPVANWIVKS